LILVLVLLVVAPVALLTVLGARIARDDREIAAHRWRDLVAARLVAVDDQVREFLQAHIRPFTEYSWDEAETGKVSDALTATGLVRQLFVIGDDGMLMFPKLSAESSTKDREFFQRTTELWRSRDPLFHPPDAIASPGDTPAMDPSPDATPFQQTPLDSGGLRLASGWYTWHWSDGLNFIFWWRDGQGHTVGIELERMRLIADIVGVLPDTAPEEAASERIVLTDSHGNTLYQWGNYESRDEARPVYTLPLSPPLSAWTLNYYGPPDMLAAAGGRAVWFNLAAGGAAISIALAGLALYLYRESSREMREAARRVTFVNQVSHELKTPLTNIRMYAELLEDELAGDPRAARSLGVIVSESQRLSRLIGNILTFSRRQRRALALHPKPGCIEKTVRAVLERARPALEARGMKVCFECADGDQAAFDADALEQILNNLINNVEKYAADGGYLGMRLCRDGDMAILTVEDRGPGIPNGEYERIFQPFYRLSNKISDGVTGTGIGLALSRELARLHGGDLRVIHGDGGAVFELRLHAPVARGVAT